MGKVVGPGSLNVDFSGYIPRFPTDGESVVGSGFKLSPGGKGSNQMTAASRAGAEVIMLGCMGRDPLSSVITDHYNAENMTMNYIRISETKSTGMALIEINEESGQNRIIVIPGASYEVSAEQVLEAENVFKECDAVLCQFETSLGSIKEAIRLGKKYKKPIILNPAPFINAPESIYDGVDYLTPNETEAEYMTGICVDSTENARKAAEMLREKGAKKIIITLGKRGSYYFDGEKEILLPCLPLKAVDTTGAGDAFNGGFAAAISDGFDDETALKFATCTSNIAVTRKGSSVAMPRRDEIVELMRSAYGIDI